MTQISGLWNGAVLGDADALTVAAADGIGYRLANSDYESYYVDRFSRMIFNGDENRGVLKGWLNELEVTGVGSPVAVNTGGAIVYGMPYQNTSSVNVAVTSPTNDTRQDRVVLRRDWDAQTIRITLITGVEGGGIPAMTQSPAPSGSGVYDIPLASLSTTTGGVITVTDAREFCRFGTSVRDGAFAAAQIEDNSVDLANERATTTKRLFIGGGDLHPMTSAGRFSLSATTSILMQATASWNGAANEEAWQVNSAGANYEAVIGTFRTPPDYASGSIYTYIWYVDNAGIAPTCYLYSYVQMKSLSWSQATAISGSEYFNSANAVSDVYRGDGAEIEADSISDNGTDGTWNYCIAWYNAAGAEDIGIMGLEIEYTGYI